MLVEKRFLKLHIKQRCLNPQQLISSKEQKIMSNNVSDQPATSLLFREASEASV